MDSDKEQGAGSVRRPVRTRMGDTIQTLHQEQALDYFPRFIV